MEELRQAIEIMTKEELVKFIIILSYESGLSISVVNDILGNMSQTFN